LVGASDRATREALTAALAAEGYEVCGAADARELQRRLPPAAAGPGPRFDAILWGFELRDGDGDGDGFERRLSDPSFARALIIVRRGGGRLAAAAEAWRLGASAILDGSGNADEVGRTVRAALGHA
jgi:DNA-binding NtrC family response regulator